MGKQIQSAKLHLNLEKTYGTGAILFIGEYSHGLLLLFFSVDFQSSATHTGSLFKVDGYVVFSSLITAAVGQRETQHLKCDL